MAQKNRQARTNPNAPISAAEKQEQLKEVQAEVNSDSVRDSLPDDPEMLKDLLVSKIKEGEKADTEIAQLQHDAVQNRHKLENYPKMEKALSAKVKAGTEKIMPLLGYHNAEHKIDILGAPIGDGSGPRELMTIVLQDGNFVGIACTQTKHGINDNLDGYWKIK